MLTAAMGLQLRKGELVLHGLAVLLVIAGAATLSATGHQSAAAIMAGVGVGTVTFFLLVLALLRKPTPDRAPSTGTEVAQGLSSLTPLDRALWGRMVEGILRDENSTLWIHVSKDGIVASTVGLVGRLWLLPCNAFIVGLVLVDLQTGQGVVIGLGWFLIAMAGISFLIAVTRISKAGRARRAFRNAHT